MKAIVAKGFTLSVLIYAVLHFIHFFAASPLSEALLPIAGFLSLAFAFGVLPLRKLQLQIFLAVTAIGVLAATSESFVQDLALAFVQMKSLIALLLIVPMISWVLREEPYIEEIMSFGHKWLNKSQTFYVGLMGMTQIISHFLLFGVVPMMYRFIDSFLKDYKDEAWENYKGTAILRGFALSTMWVISIPSFIFAVVALDATLWKSMLLGLAAAIAGTILSVAFAKAEEKRYGTDFSAVLANEIDKAVANSRNPGRWNKDVAEFSFLFISLFGTIFVIHEWSGVDFLVVIPLVILVWTFLYFLVKKRTGSYAIQAAAYYKEGVSKQAQQFSILLSAGLLIYALNQSAMGSYVIESMNYLTAHVPFLNLLFLIPFIVIILGFIGLGPLPVIVLVTGVLESAVLPFPPELVVLAVTSGSVISIILSPFVMPVIILSSINGLNGIRNGLRFNWKFAVAFYVMTQVFVQTLFIFSS
ncbi:hypothetical protein [Planococcus dechangensis]|uniref:DUF401 family protein n=1 Tax=Planococcus dechangensis TaxID=1176255 RepID=A0ABV9MA75_9BACL